MSETEAVGSLRIDDNDPPRGKSTPGFCGCGGCQTVREKAQEFIQQIMEEEESRSPHPARRAERCPSGSPHTTRKRAETTTAGPRERADGSRSIRRPGIRQKWYFRPTVTAR